MTAPTELVKGNAVVLILSILVKEPLHGYGIIKALREVSEGYFTMSEGTLYPHLHRLENDKLIEGYWDTSTGSQERRYYRITEHGTAELARRTKELSEFHSQVSRVLGLAHCV